MFPLSHLCKSPQDAFRGSVHYLASSHGFLDGWKVDCLADLPQTRCLVFLPVYTIHCVLATVSSLRSSIPSEVSLIPSVPSENWIGFKCGLR